MRHDHHLPSWPGDDRHSVALAAELISSRNVVGCGTGSCDGLAPLRIRPA